MRRPDQLPTGPTTRFVPTRSKSPRTRAISLIELVVVILIIGVLAAIAIPRLSVSADASKITATRRNFDLLNKAVELYHAEHDRYPTEDEIAAQLTRYSDKTGSLLADAPDPSSGIIYGPYLVKIPPLPIGPNEGETRIFNEHRANTGWLYEEDDHVVRPDLHKNGGTIPQGLAREFEDLLGNVAVEPPDGT